MRFVSVSVILLSAGASPASADYLGDTGYYELAAELGSSTPDGSGISVTQVEAGTEDYLPEAGSGTFVGSLPLFLGKTFVAKSGSSGASVHAVAVGEHFYSFNTRPSAGRATFTPGIGWVDGYLATDFKAADSWLGGAWLYPAGGGAPLIESRAVQNHSWISQGTEDSAAEDREALQRFDFAIHRDGFLSVTGVNNGESPVPALMASAYNNLSVGLSSGNHSSGGVSGSLDGPGRQKPEIVAPLDYTSFSTALVSSAGAFLRQAAFPLGANAGRPETLKAILLTGATKDRFPAWHRTPSAPLDPRFGAGELHVGNSWRILAGREQIPNQTTVSPVEAWDRVTLSTATSATYLVRVAPGKEGRSFTATAVWHRIVSDSQSGPGFTPSAATLADYQLSLERIPVSGPAISVDQSTSSLENLEHLYQTHLPSGLYRLRLSLAKGSNVAASVAWQMRTIPHAAGLAISRERDRMVLSFTGLLPGQAYVIQESADALTWKSVDSFQATGTASEWNTAFSPQRKFFRLAAMD